jgi:hypothetical protein
MENQPIYKIIHGAVHEACSHVFIGVGEDTPEGELYSNAINHISQKVFTAIQTEAKAQKKAKG